MEARRHHQPLDRPEAEADVGVDEYRVERDEHQVGVDRGRREPQQVERHEREPARDDDVEQMQAGAGQPVHGLGRMMDGVKPPQPRARSWNVRCTTYSARSATTTISTNCRTSGCACTARCSPGHTAHANSTVAGTSVSSTMRLQQQVAHREVREVGAPAEAEDRLGAQPAERSLHRNEDRATSTSTLSRNQSRPDVAGGPPSSVPTLVVDPPSSVVTAASASALAPSPLERRRSSDSVPRPKPATRNA